MTIDVQTILYDSRNYLSKLGAAIEELVTIYPDIFQDSGMKERLEAFFQAHREAAHRLENPNLLIATIGTTSSGKSTIVNALIGCKVAPIEAGEMSGGVLTLQHSNDRRLIVEETEGATWETGTWSGLSDEALYDRIRNSVMLPYHDTRKEKNCLAPKVTTFIPLLPVCDRHLLSLPPGVGIELIDLPGLKSIQDLDNLKVIQEKIHSSFSLVALDYTQVDDEHRKRLLEELKLVVHYLQGRTDSMMFILNRVDRRGADDIPISERVAQLKREIQEALSLQEPPDILPFNARLLYYAQCAWGSAPLDQASSVEQLTRLKLLEAMFQDCAGAIRQHIDDDRVLRRWFRDVEERVCDRQDIDDQTMREILQCARKWSGGQDLWNCLQKRIQESFSKLVILPALVEVLDYCESLATALDSVVRIKKIEQKEEVEVQKSTIDDISQQMQLAQQVQKQGRQGFHLLLETADKIDKDLALEVIAPIRYALKNNQSADEVEKKLSNVITPAVAHEIAKAYDLASQKFKYFTKNSGYLVRRVREGDSKGIKELQELECVVCTFYQAMREALSVRAEFMLQAQAQKLEIALEYFVKQQEKELCYVEVQAFTTLKSNQAIYTNFKNHKSSNLPVLPKLFFKLTKPIYQLQIVKQEVIREKSKADFYAEISSLKNQYSSHVNFNSKGIIYYRELVVPDADMMAQQWAEGVKRGKNGLWDIMANWMIARLVSTSSIVDKSVDEVTNLAKRTLQEQLQSIEQNFEIKMQRWDEFQSQQHLITKIRDQLKAQFH